MEKTQIEKGWGKAVCPTNYYDGTREKSEGRKQEREMGLQILRGGGRKAAAL